MQSDVELSRLTGQGAATGREGSARARRLSAVTGARDAETAVAAVEALRGVLWEALLSELRDPTPRLIGDVGDRLGYVCSRTLAATIAATELETSESSDDERPTATTEANRGDTRQANPGAGARVDAVIVDERADVQHPVQATPSVQLAGAPVLAAQPDEERPLAWDESPPVVPVPSQARLTDERSERPVAWDSAPQTRAADAPGEIEIRDQRRDEGPSAWIGTIGRQLARFRHDGLAFSVLLVELLEIDGMRAGESSTELAELSAQVQDALTGELRTLESGSLTCEGPGRYWLLAPETDRSAAERLGERLTRAVAVSVSYRHTPVEIVVGIAACPDDGLQAPMLAAHADVGLYAARSAARTLSGRPAGI
jgi:hypothetical protein